MSEPPPSARDAIATAVLQGRPPEAEALGRVDDRELARLFRQLLSESGATARAGLAALIRREPGRAGDLAAEALGKWGGAEAGALLRAIDPSGLPSARRKALRRALHFHESHHGAGMTRPPAAPAPAPAVAPVAFLTAPDAAGTRLWFFRRPEPAGRGGRLAAVTVSDQSGVVDFLWLDGSDAAFKRVCRRAAEDGLVLCEVPWDYLRFRLRKAERPTADAHPAPPPNYEGLRRWLDLEAAAATELPHPAAPVSSILEIGSPVLPPHVHHLFALPETRGWLLSTEAFAADREALEAAERSRLVLDGRDPRERVLDVLRRVIDRYRVPAVCEVWSLRLLDLALVLNGSDRARAGRIAAQVAGALAAAESTAVAHEFFRVMGMRTLDRLLAPPAAAPQAAGPAPEHDGSGLVF